MTENWRSRGDSEHSIKRGSATAEPWAEISLNAGLLCSPRVSSHPGKRILRHARRCMTENWRSRGDSEHSIKRGSATAEPWAEISLNAGLLCSPRVSSHPGKRILRHARRCMTENWRSRGDSEHSIKRGSATAEPWAEISLNAGLLCSPRVSSHPGKRILRHARRCMTENWRSRGDSNTRPTA